jgi:hypothetical protein
MSLKPGSAAKNGVRNELTRMCASSADADIEEIVEVPEPIA